MEVRLDDIIVTKTGDSRYIQECNLHGQNAAILIKDGAIATINKATVTSTALGANGIFLYGSSKQGAQTQLDVADSTIMTNGNNSSGLVSASNGESTADDLIVNTSGTYSPCASSNEGNNILKLNRGTYTSSGLNSPAIYCRSDIAAKDCTLIAHSSPGLVVEGIGSLLIDDCAISANDKFAFDDSNTKCSVLVYDTDRPSTLTQPAELSIRGGRFDSSQGHFMHISNTSAKVLLEDVDIYNTDDDNIFISVSNDIWAGHDNLADITLRDIKVFGNILVDDTPSELNAGKSKLDLTLSSSSQLAGSINTSIDANHRGQVNLNIGQSCRFKLTADSYVTSIVNEGIVETGLYTLYVNGEPYSGGTSPEDVPSKLEFRDGTYILDGNYGNIVVNQDSKTEAIAVEIIKPCTLMITGNAVNATIRIKHDVKDVNVMLSSSRIDNTRYSEVTNKDASVFILEENADASITLKGTNTFVGPNKYVKFARPLVRGNGSVIKFLGLGELVLEDAMPEMISFSQDTYPHGIDNPEGKLIFMGGTLNIRSNGHAIQAYKGDVTIDGSIIRIIHSGLDSINCDDGNFAVNSGKLLVTESDRRGISCRAINKLNMGNIVISGGDIDLFKIADVGIKGEDVTISGGNLNITNIYDCSGESTYVTGNDVPHKNTIYPVTDAHDKIRINLNVGYHDGIEVGTRAKRYSYVYVPTSDEEHEAGKIYTQPASGSFSMSGGTVSINTVVTGLITKTLYTQEGYEPCSTNTYVIGAPGNGISCYGTVSVSGGQLTLQSAGDGIQCDGSVTISGSAEITMPIAYHGIAAANIISGTADYSIPSVTINSIGDSVQTITSTFEYIYDDSRDEDCNYTLNIYKTNTAGSVFLYAGKFNAAVDPDDKKEVELRVKPEGTKKLVEYKANGRCIYSNEYVYFDGSDCMLAGINDSDNMAPVYESKGFLLNDTSILIMTSFNSNDECIPDVGDGLYLKTEDSGLEWTDGASFKLATPEGQPIYQTTLTNPGRCVLVAHPELVYNRLYAVSVNDKTYLLRAKEPLR